MLSPRIANIEFLLKHNTVLETHAAVECLAKIVAFLLKHRRSKLELCDIQLTEQLAYTTREVIKVCPRAFLRRPKVVCSRFNTQDPLLCLNYFNLSHASKNSRSQMDFRLFGHYS